MPDLNSERHTFIVRLTEDGLAPSQDRILWRGKVLHVSTRNEAAVQSLVEVYQFMKQTLEPTRGDATSTRETDRPDRDVDHE